MRLFIRKYWSDSFWRNNAIFLIGSLFVAFINYLYHPVLGRLMDVSSFGEVQVLLSLFNLIAMLFAALQIVIINISANSDKTSVTIIQQFEYLALLIMSVFLVSIIIGSSWLKDFFNFTSHVPFIVLGVILILSVLIGFRQAYIQGRSNFTAVSIAGGIGASSKLLFSAALILLGLGTFGAIAGILIAQTLTLLYVLRVATRTGFTSSLKSFTLPDFNLLRPELRYLFSVMTVFFIVTLLYTGDILVAKRYFEPDIAGQYAGISAIAKIIFFVTGSFAGVLLASVGQSYPANHNKAIARKSLMLVAGIGGLAFLLFTLVPNFIISIMLGGRYVEYAYLLPQISLVTYLVSIINIYFYYFLALRQYIIVPIALVGGVVTLTLTTIRHDTLEAVVQNFLLGSIIVITLLVSLGIYYRISSFRKMT